MFVLELYCDDIFPHFFFYFDSKITYYGIVLIYIPFTFLIDLVTEKFKQLLRNKILNI